MLSPLVSLTYSGGLSLIGSGTIISMIFRSKKKTSTPFRRIILGLSICDIFLSLAYVLSTVPSPKGLGIWNAHGNQVTCQIQASLFQLGIRTSQLIYVKSSKIQAYLSLFYVSSKSGYRSMPSRCQLISCV